MYSSAEELSPVTEFSKRDKYHVRRRKIRGEFVIGPSYICKKKLVCKIDMLCCPFRIGALVKEAATDHQRPHQHALGGLGKLTCIA